MIRIAALLLAIMIAGQPLAAQAQGRFGRGVVGGVLDQLDQAGRGPDRGDRQDSRPGAQRGGQTISMEQAVAIVARRSPGRLLDASPAGPNYRITWLTSNGRRVDFMVDASSGAILRADGE
jgi:uncharacterized membrane protein YkoI